MKGGRYGWVCMAAGSAFVRFGMWPFSVAIERKEDENKAEFNV